MFDALNRHELLIQSVTERNEDCCAIIPIHSQVLQLPLEVRLDKSILKGAITEVRKSYDEDMRNYLAVLGVQRHIMPWLEGYEKFNDNWVLDSKPGLGFLDLTWIDHKQEEMCVGLLSLPTIIYNQFNEHKKFYSPEDWKADRWVPVMGRSINNEDVVAMSPEKMRKYGFENGIAKIEKHKGEARVISRVFHSEYYGNLAIPLLLRNYAVVYHNKLLEVAEDRMK